jgi:hypothetical protein
LIDPCFIYFQATICVDFRKPWQSLPFCEHLTCQAAIRPSQKPPFVFGEGVDDSSLA